MPETRALLDQGRALASAGARVPVIRDEALADVVEQHRAAASRLAAQRGLDPTPEVIASRAIHLEQHPALAESLARLDRVDEAVRPLRSFIHQVLPALTRDLDAAEPVATRTLFRKPAPEAVDAFHHVEQTLAWASAKNLDGRLAAVDDAARPAPVDSDDLPRLAEVLADTVDLRPGLAGAAGVQSERTIADAEALSLDTSRFSAELRPYQDFGARFLLSTRRAILGDGLGLDTRLQALAGLAHLFATGRKRLAVVCAPSDIDEWFDEAVRHTQVPTTTVGQIDPWLAHGGLLLIPSTALPLDLPEDAAPEALVVDAAATLVMRHTTELARLAASAAYVWYLPTYPLETSPDALIGLARTLGVRLVPTSRTPDVLRHEFADVYLRRSAAEVSEQLPRLWQTRDVVQPDLASLAAYRDAVAIKNFSSMRRAGFARPETSPKMERLVRLVQAGQADDQLVVVFSYFFTVLTEIEVALKAAGVSNVVGPMTPSMPADEREEAFASIRPTSVLLTQLSDANQASTVPAGVVILCEPQTNPAIEVRAIARCRGTQPLQVRRLVTAELMDSLLLDIVGSEKILDGASAGTMTEEEASVSEAGLARRIVTEETARLGLSTR